MRRRGHRVTERSDWSGGGELQKGRGYGPGVGGEGAGVRVEWGRGRGHTGISGAAPGAPGASAALLEPRQALQEAEEGVSAGGLANRRGFRGPHSHF